MSWLPKTKVISDDRKLERTYGNNNRNDLSKPLPFFALLTVKCTLLLLSLTTVAVACAFNFAGVYFWIGNFKHDMRYISAFHVFEFIIMFVGMLCLAFGLITNSIPLIAVFISTFLLSSVSRILCIVFSFGFLVFDEQHCAKTFYSSIHGKFKNDAKSDNKVLAELVCRREICIPLLIINIVLLIFHIASIVSANQYVRILRYEKESTLRHLIQQISASPSPPLYNEDYSDTANKKDIDESIRSKRMHKPRTPTVHDVAESVTGYSLSSTKSSSSNASSRSSSKAKSHSSARSNNSNVLST